MAKVEEQTTPAAPSWQADFKLKEDLRQRDVYAFEQALYEFERALQNSLGETQMARIAQRIGLQMLPPNVWGAHALKAAIQAGWIERPEAEVLNKTNGTKVYHYDGADVEELHAGKVRWYGDLIAGHYNSLVSPPPN